MKHTAAVDVTAAMPEGVQHGEPTTIAVDVVADPAKIAAEPVVVLAIPGGTYHRRYWDLQPPGRRGYSQAEWMADRGVIFVASDYLGGGDSSRPADGDRTLGLGSQPSCSPRLAELAASAALRRLTHLPTRGSALPGATPMPREEETMTVERFPVEAGHIMLFARAIGDANPAYYGAMTGSAAVPTPPTFVQASAQFDPDYFLRPKIGQPWFGSGRNATGVVRTDGGAGGGGGGLHAEQHYEYHRPLRAGDVLTATVRDGATWEKQGRRGGKLVFIESITEYHDQSGELVVTVRRRGADRESCRGFRWVRRRSGAEAANSAGEASNLLGSRART